MFAGYGIVLKKGAGMRNQDPPSRTWFDDFHKQRQESYYDLLAT